MNAPPTAIHSEQRVLGALLADKTIRERVASILSAKHFADPIHTSIFAAIGERAGVTLEELATDPGHMLDAVGGAAYLVRLVAEAHPVSPTEDGDVLSGAFDIAADVRDIRDAWLRREIIDLGTVIATVGEEAVEAAFEAAVPAVACAALLRDSLVGLSARAHALEAGAPTDTEAARQSEGEAV